VINALENIRSARDLAVRARNSSNDAISRELLKLAIAEAADAAKVLNCANLHFKAQRDLVEAIATLAVASAIDTKFLRDPVITEGIQDLDAARTELRF
jgi:hypothetical protein